MSILLLILGGIWTALCLAGSCEAGARGRHVLALVFFVLGGPGLWIIGLYDIKEVRR